MRLTNSTKTKIASVLLVAICASVVAPALAGAQQVDPTSSQYDDTLTQLNSGSTPPNGPDTETKANDTDTGLGGRVGPLPFTGFDVIAMAAVALAVTGLGLALQRAVSREPTDGLS